MVDPDRRALLAAAGAVAPLTLAPTAAGAEPRIVMNDASRLSPTPVLRHWVVAPDDTPVLAYAGTERIAAVMSFSQEISPEGEVDMITLTEALIDRVGAIGGSVDLPYRLHARPDQVQALYPRYAQFAQRKRRYDPRGVFRHALWDTYLAD
jgi:hypothetical protein